MWVLRYLCTVYLIHDVGSDSDGMYEVRFGGIFFGGVLIVGAVLTSEFGGSHCRACLLEQHWFLRRSFQYVPVEKVRCL